MFALAARLAGRCFFRFSFVFEPYQNPADTTRRRVWDAARPL